MQTAGKLISVGHWTMNLPLLDFGYLYSLKLNDSSYLAKMHLIKHNLIWMANAPESCDESQDRDNGKSQFVVPV